MINYACFCSSSQAAHRRLQGRRARLQRVAAVAELSWEAAKDVAGLVVFSALPFVAVQALADSQAGKDLLARLEEQKPLLQREAAQRERERAAARSERCAAGTFALLSPMGTGAGNVWPCLCLRSSL